MKMNTDTITLWIVILIGTAADLSGCAISIKGLDYVVI